MTNRLLAITGIGSSRLAGDESYPDDTGTTAGCMLFVCAPVCNSCAGNYGINRTDRKVI